MPPDCQHAFFVSGLAKLELILSNPGMFKSMLFHVSVRNIKSIFEMASTKSLFLVLLPRTMLSRPLMFDVLKEIFENFFFSAFGKDK